MSSTPTSPAPSTNRLQGFVLGFVVFACLSLIGLTGYVKFRLDQAESALISPTIQDASNESITKLRRDLGHGGFLGLAQNFALTHDPALLPDMKTQVKNASERVEKLSEKAGTDLRHDMQAIVGNFTAALEKAEKSTVAGGADFTANDLAPLYAAVPTLDARLNAALITGRDDALRQTQFWSMALTLIGWCSLVIAAALAAWLHLVRRERNAAPLRALAQSVKNMSRGDMRSPIWGMERQDAVGELARAIDMARFHFSQLPDMSLLSEQGPVRIRFEGNTRSLFEAMIKVISRDSEQVHDQATALTQAVAQQQESLNLLAQRVEAVLHSVESRAISGDQQVRQALQSMVGSAESLKHAQEHAADQLGRIIPFLQERASNLAEMAHVTGKNVIQALQSLNQTERGLKTSAEQSEEAIRKFFSTADTLGERMFGAVNLLQASGKVLAETTEKTQNKLEEAIAKVSIPATAMPMPGQETVTTPSVERAVKALEETESRLQKMLSESRTAPVVTTASLPDTGSAERLEKAVAALEDAETRLEKILSEQSDATRAHIDLLTTQSQGLLTQSTTAAQSLSVAADRLRDEQAKLGSVLNEAAAKFDALAVPQTAAPDTSIADKIAAHLDRLAARIDEAVGILTDLPARVTAQLPATPTEFPEPAFAAPLLADVRSGFSSISNTLASLHDRIAALPAPEKTPAELFDQMRDHWYQMAAQIEATRDSLAKLVTQQAERIEAHLSGDSLPPIDTAAATGTRAHMEQQTHILGELVATLGLLDAHMQELRSQVTESRQRAG